MTTGMRLEVIERASEASGLVNEDRIGLCGAYAWVIDGATDVAEERLLPGESDAAWLAGTIDAVLQEIAPRAPRLEEALAIVTHEAAQRFAVLRRREPRARHELPSAAGILMRLEGAALEWLSLGDCSLFMGESGKASRILAGGSLSAGDRRMAQAIRDLQTSEGLRRAEATRAALMPRLRASRSDMNLPGGYGVFSVVPVPAEHVRVGRLEVGHGAHLLLASDGFVRLADPYARYGIGELADAARRRGLAALLAELRAIEAGDPDCLRIPRAKPRDDASALSIEIA